MLCVLATSVAGALFRSAPSGGILGALLGHKLQVHSIVATLAMALVASSVGFQSAVLPALLFQVVGLASRAPSCGAAATAASAARDKGMLARWLTLGLYVSALAMWASPSDLDDSGGLLEASLAEAMRASSMRAMLLREGVAQGARLLDKDSAAKGAFGASGSALFAWCSLNTCLGGAGAGSGKPECHAEPRMTPDDLLAWCSLHGCWGDVADTYRCAFKGLQDSTTLKRLAPIAGNGWVANNLWAASALQDATLAFLQVHGWLGGTAWLTQLGIMAPLGALLFLVALWWEGGGAGAGVAAPAPVGAAAAGGVGGWGGTWGLPVRLGWPGGAFAGAGTASSSSGTPAGASPATPSAPSASSVFAAQQQQGPLSDPRAGPMQPQQSPQSLLQQHASPLGASLAGSAAAHSYPSPPRSPIFTSHGRSGDFYPTQNNWGTSRSYLPEGESNAALGRALLGVESRFVPGLSSS